jgi:serine/threonine protein kinase
VSGFEQHDGLIGRIVAGRYEVLRKINEGGVGAVYLAMQRPLDRPVALKVLLKKHADDPTAIRRFEKEAAAVARLTHAHVVTLYDFGHTDDGDLYIAMELLRGSSVRELLDAAGYLPWERALHIIIGVTRALVAAHTQKIVHRDLKPENIMLVESNGDLDFAKVLDFGLARSITQSSGPQITRHDVIPGTPAYMSPERANGISDDPRSDLYAVGAMWFEMLTGLPPFPGETSIKVILRHVHETPKRPSLAQPKNSIPSFIDDIILDLLAKLPDDRPTSARALLDELERLQRPAGWHVGGAGDVARHGRNDASVRDFSAAAATLVEDDELHFAVEHIPPTPLTRKKPLLEASPEPLLLTKKKVEGDVTMRAIAPPAGQPERGAAAGEWSASPASPRRQTTEDLLTPTRGTPAKGLMPSPSSTLAPVSAPPPAPARIDSVAQVASWLQTAKTARSVGELCSAFLQTRFDRVLIVDLRQTMPIVLAQSSLGSSSGPSMPAIVYALQNTDTVVPLAARREAYYGPVFSTPPWMAWFGALGGSMPGAMFVGGLGREGRAAYLFYADHKDVTLRPMVKDTVILLREAATALSNVG